MCESSGQPEDASKLGQQTQDVDLHGTTTVEDRWNMMWQLTIAEYAKKGIDITKQTMRKDIAILRRLKDE